ncbi:MAG: hypothetical protein ACTSYD_03880 [Candidatus Heimdallarchaeaceae archaeon]
MENKIDIGKHIFYTSWAIILVLGILTVSSVTFYDYLYLFTISYDITLLILSWGIYRLRELGAKKNKILVIILLIVYAVVVDLIQTIVAKTVSELTWSSPLMGGLRLFWLISHLLALTAAFALIKIIYDDLFEKQVTKKRMTWFTAVGYFLLLYPYIVAWYTDINPGWMENAFFTNLAIFMYMFSVIFIILGLIDLGMALLVKGTKEEIRAQQLSSEQSSEEISEIEEG